MSFLNVFYKEVSDIYFLKENWIDRQLAPFREWSEEEFFPEALALNPTYFQWELDVACLWVCSKIQTCYLLFLYQGPQIPRNLEFTCVSKELRIHWYQQKGFQFTVCPYGAGFVQSFILKSYKLHSGSACVQTGWEGGAHTLCTAARNSLSFGSKHSAIKECAEEPSPWPTALSKEWKACTAVSLPPF